MRERVSSDYAHGFAALIAATEQDKKLRTGRSLGGKRKLTLEERVKAERLRNQSIGKARKRGILEVTIAIDTEVC